MTSVLITERRGRFEKEMPREEGQVKMEAEIGMRLPQAKKHHESPEARRGREWVLPWRLQREYGPADTLILDC